MPDRTENHYRSSRSERAQLMDDYRAQRSVGKVAQNDKLRADEIAALQKQRQDLIDAGALEGSIPIPRADMDKQQFAALQERISWLAGQGRTRRETTPDPLAAAPTAAPSETPLRRVTAAPNPMAQAAANSPVANSPVPLNVNSANARAVGATFASPPPVAQNLKMLPDGRFVPKTGDELLPSQKAPQMTAPAPVPNGKVLSTAQGNALFGEVQGANGYGTGSVSYAKPGSAPTPLVADPENTGPKRDAVTPFDQQAAHDALFKSHPEIWQEGSPQNRAFVAHAKKYGAQAAYQNAPALMATLQPSSGGPSAQSAKNDLPNGDQAMRDAAYAAMNAPTPPPADALIDPNSALAKVAHPMDTLNNIGNAIGNKVKGAGRATLEAVGVTPKGVSAVGSFLDDMDVATGLKKPSNSIAPANPVGLNPSAPSPFAQPPQSTGPMPVVKTAPVPPTNPFATGTPLALGPQPVPLGVTMANTNILDDFAHSEHEDDFKKKLQFTGFNDGK